MRIFIKYTIAAFAITLTSCSGEKDWTCTCTNSTGGKSTYNINKAKKKLAKERCQEYQGAGENCSL